MSSNKTRFSAYSIAAALALLVTFDRPLAGGRGGPDGVVGYVTAESSTGKTVTAPVRMGPRGYQVLVPKHGWAYCEYKCSYTLRKYYLDFWAYQTDRFIPSDNFVWRRGW